jgi:thiol-disulfide isomerase/thioredoxin
MIRGSIGSKVRLTVVSEGADDREARDVLLTRERLNLDPAEPLEDDAAKPDAEAHDSATPGLVFERLPGGEADNLSNYRGKIVVLEFWATWCGPCEGAMADLQRSAAHLEKLRDKLVFISVSMDRAKDAPAARLKEKGWADALNGWADRKALAPWQIHGLPTTYVLDADGHIVAGNPRMTQQMVEDLVKVLLKN